MSPKTVLCLASYEKGQEFLRECKRRGHQVILLTMSSLENADWPREIIDEFFHMPDLSNVDDVIRAVSYLARTRIIDRVVPLDDYDVETVAALREHLRLPGLNASTARLFRDKLAMRVRAHEAGLLVPDFVHVLNHEQIHEFTRRVSPPWVLKPRSEVSSIGIARITTTEELWLRVNTLEDRQSFFLLERYIPGEVYHVDSIVSEGEVVFSEVHRYRHPPMDVFHGGGIASTRTVLRGADDEQALHSMNRDVIRALGLGRGVSHIEFIRGPEDHIYFLEAAARVGGANTAEMVEAATGINLWTEWARIEIAQGEEPYQLPPRRYDYGGVIISLARQEYPDTSAYTDPEIVLRSTKRSHVGFVVASFDPKRVEHLLDEYAQRFSHDFAAVLPGWMERPATT